MRQQPLCRALHMGLLAHRALVRDCLALGHTGSAAALLGAFAGVHSRPISTSAVTDWVGRLREGMSQSIGQSKMFYPDIHDPNEALICKKYLYHGVVIDPYTKPGQSTSINPLVDKQHDKWLGYFWDRVSTTWVCARSISRYDTRSLKEYVIDAYKNINVAIATGNLSLGAPYMSDLMRERLVAEVRLRPARSRVVLNLATEPTTATVKLVHGKVIPNPLQQGRLHFVQWTVKIPSEQAIAVYDHHGKLIAGDPDKVIPVEDYWVFERPILKSHIIPKPGPQGARWRLIERLSFPDQAPAEAPQQQQAGSR